MIAKSPEQTQNAQAYLILLYGAPEGGQKHYPLDSDALIIGKSPGCDLVLQAPDVSHLHCVVTRHIGGWTVRDCNSRSGIRLNGDKVCEASLHDDDVLHVGPFSFRVKLPPKRAASAGRTTETRLLKLDRKRRNLARIALVQRKRLHQLQARLRQAPPGQVLDDDRVHLTHSAEILQERLRDVQERNAEMDRAERELANERALLERDVGEFRERMLRKELEVRDRQANLEREWQQRRVEVDREAARLRKEAARGPTEEAREAEGARELAARAEALEQEFEQRRLAFEQEMAQRREQWEQERRRLQALQPPVASSAAASPKAGSEDAAPVPAAPAVEEESLEQTRLLPDQDLELTCLLGEPDLEKTQVVPGATAQEEIRRLHLRRQELDFYVRHVRRSRQRLDEDRRQLELAQQQLTQEILAMQIEQLHNAAARAQWERTHADAMEQLQRQQAALAQSEEMLREQRDVLQRMLEEAQQLREQNSPQDDGAAALRQENEELRRRLEEREQEQAARQARSDHEAAFLAEFEQVHQENELLRRLLEEKNALLEELRQQVDSPPDNPSILEVSGGYEAEVTRYRHQLAADRAGLNEEIEAFKQRNEELDEATREMEMQFSRERAELARERTRLDRLRDEVRAEVERLQRDGGLTDRLAPIHKLREEINERRQAAPPLPKDNGLFRGLRNPGKR